MAAEGYRIDKVRQMLETKEKRSNKGTHRARAKDELVMLLSILPERIRTWLEEQPNIDDLVEAVLDLGRSPEARFSEKGLYFEDHEVTRADLDHVVSHIGSFTADNRAGIERTLHRISALRNRKGEVIGVTCRVGRAITGTVDIIRDVIETGKSLLLLGPPGVGKTTLLREAARFLADEMGKRVVIVDTSNEIAGDGDVPHPSIGHARRMQVPSPEMQHSVMIEAVENHMPEVIVIDEIGTELEAMASRTIAERGVQLVATAHGVTLDNLIINPTLSDLVGGVQPVTLSDEEARRRRTQKTVLERKAPPTFDILVEIKDRDRLAIYPDISRMVDQFLSGAPLYPETRVRTLEGAVMVEPALGIGRQKEILFGGNRANTHTRKRLRRPVRIYPIAISRTRLEKAIREVGSPVRLADQPINADVVLSLKAQRKREPKKLRQALDAGVEFHTIKNNTLAQIKAYLGEQFPGKHTENKQNVTGSALQQAEDAIIQVQRNKQPVELPPRNSYLRRLQHELVQDHGLRSESVGIEPFRHVIVFPE
jgi:stage III sporulation protein SpoIIIAA